MKSSRILAVVLAVLVLLMLGLGGLFLWLNGGQKKADSGSKEKAVEGLIHVRSIYVGNNENLYKPVGIGADADGGFFVTLRDSQRVIEFDRQGDWIRSWGEKGLEPGQIMVPTGVAVDRLAGHVYVTDRSRLRLICFSLEGKYLWEIPLLNPIHPVVMEGRVAVTTFGPLAIFSSEGEVLGEIGSRGYADGQFDYPRGAATFDSDELIVADSNNNRIQHIRLEGEATATALWVDGMPPRKQDDTATAYGLPSGVAVDSRGRAYVLDSFRHRIVVLNGKSGKKIHEYDELEGEKDGHFKLPTGIAYLGGDYFAITDTFNDRVQIVRLLLPSEDTIVRRYPALWGLLPLAALALLWPLFGRRRWYATEEALRSAHDSGDLPLLLAVTKKISVLPEVRAGYEGVSTEGVNVAEYLVAADAPADGSAEARLSGASNPGGWRRLFSLRSRVITSDDVQAGAFKELGCKTATCAEIRQQYSIVGRDENAPPPAN